jgi:hypothetical protein
VLLCVDATDASLLSNAQERSYDALPNFTAVDGVRLLGIGRNQYIDIMNRCRQRVLIQSLHLDPRALGKVIHHTVLGCLDAWMLAVMESTVQQEEGHDQAVASNRTNRY